VDWIRSCYSSQWQLLRGGPPTRGYYYYCPPGTPHYPGLHLIGSRNWTRGDPARGTPLIGEWDGPQRYSRGSLPVPPPPAVVLGSADCIALGDTYPLPMVDRTLPYGIDSRCYSSGSAPVDHVPPLDMLVWLRPDSIALTPDGQQLTRWPDSGRLGNDAVIQGQLRPTPVVRAAGLAGLTDVRCDGRDRLGWAGLPLGAVHTAYVVGTLGAQAGPGGYGPGVISLVQQADSLLGTLQSGTYYHDTGVLALDLTSVPPDSAQLWWYRRTLADVTLGRGVTSLVVAVGMAPVTPVLSAVGVVIAPGYATAGRCWVSEVLVYDRALSDQEHAAVVGYLRQRYGV
jgi:hypothetical protein